MSTATSIFLTHSWVRPSDVPFQKIVDVMNSDVKLEPLLDGVGKRRGSEWRPYEGFKNADEEFAAHGSTMFLLPLGVSLRLSRKLMILGTSIPWRAFVSDSDHRITAAALGMIFLVAARTKAAAFLPEGTIADDEVYKENINFDLRELLGSILGPPNLDFDKIYSGEEFGRLPKGHINYLVVADLTRESNR